MWYGVYDLEFGASAQFLVLSVEGLGFRVEEADTFTPARPRKEPERDRVLH